MNIKAYEIFKTLPSGGRVDKVMTYRRALSEIVTLEADTEIVDKKGNAFLAFSPKGQEYLLAFQTETQPLTVTHWHSHRDIR